MAQSGSQSPAFVPPMDRLIDEDSQIVKVPLDEVGIGYRKSQQGGVAGSLQRNPFTVSTIRNGR